MAPEILNCEDELLEIWPPKQQNVTMGPQVIGPLYCDLLEV